MIQIVDYGMGNLRSVQKAFEKLSAAAEICTNPADIQACESLVLPGVGAFRDAISELRRQEFVEPILTHIAAGKPFLGICLGLQLLFDVSYEDGTWEGLGVLPGKVVRFPENTELKVPHMGWNRVSAASGCPLFAGFPPESFFYFVHSYYVVPDDPAVVGGQTEYGQAFTSVVQRGKMFATQFHPEKSQKLGLQLLANFAGLKMQIELQMEIIPAIDLRGGKCVRLRQGDYSRETVFGDAPAEMALRWQRDGATRLHLVDLDGAKTGRPVNVEAIRAIVHQTGLPCQLGGGLRNEADIRLMLDDVGIERVIVGTQALKAPDWFREMADKFPGRLVLGIDARNSLVATEGWLDVSHTPALDLASGYAQLPIAAMIYTNIANDGMMSGIDVGTIDDLCRLSDLGIPVIASGGVTTVSDIENLVRAASTHPHLAGAIVGRALYEGTLTLPAVLKAAKACRP